MLGSVLRCSVCHAVVRGCTRTLTVSRRRGHRNAAAAHGFLVSAKKFVLTEGEFLAKSPPHAKR